MTLKRSQVVMLPTKEKAKLYLYKDVELVHAVREHSEGNNTYKNQHIYFLSNDEIKEGDWYHNSIDNSIKQASDWIYVSTCKKIIATTDESLKIIPKGFKSGVGALSHAYRLPQPSQYFLHLYYTIYNTGKPIEWVSIEYELNQCDGCQANLPIIDGIHRDSQMFGIACSKEMYNKLKINPKDNTITIRPIKNSWNRDEVIELIELAWATASAYGDNTNSADCNDWIEHNL